MRTGGIIITGLICFLILTCAPLQAQQGGEPEEQPGQADGSNPLFRIIKDGKYGFIDQTGKVVIAPQFDSASDFSEGLALVRIGGESTGKYGFIDKTGNYVSDPQFGDALSFSEGLAAVKTGGEWGYIDKTGMIAIDPQFSRTWGFSEGLAAAVYGNHWRYIDKSGQRVIKPKFDKAMSFSEGLASVKMGRLWGYTDKAGNYVIYPQFDEAGPFSNGLAAVRIFYPPEDMAAYLEEEIKALLTDFDPVHWEELTAYFDKNCKLGYIDKTGKYVWEPPN